MKINLPEKITDSLIKTGAAQPEDSALYEYGIKMGFLLVINVATAILIGLFLGMAWQCIVFMIAYNPVRTYSGGYHARTPLACYLLSIPMILAVLLGIKLIPWNGYVCVISTICFLLVIGFLAPVADPNKPLNEREQTVYKSRARAYSSALSGAAVIFWWLGMEQVSLSIIMALGMAAIMLVLGIVINGNHILKKA